MEYLDILTPNLNWLELVEHVKLSGVTVQLSEGNRPIAKLVPDSPFEGVSMVELDRFLRSTPPLGAEEAAAFEADIMEARKIELPPDDPWES
jgi:antitoxin (DNA-binding transcriptional repressor) of toxin-antitoxin stability system